MKLSPEKRRATLEKLMALLRKAKWVFVAQYMMLGSDGQERGAIRGVARRS